MKNTLNYNLKLPEYADIADIADLNYNAETIDAELMANVDLSYELNNKIDGKIMKKAMVYYGYPLAINGTWEINAAIDIYKSHDLIVFGAEYHNPSNEAYLDLVAVLNRLHQDFPRIETFGYVPIGKVGGGDNYTMEQIKTIIDEWVALDVTGIFLDEFGYDYQVTRDWQNEIINYCRLSNKKVFVNSWELTYIFSNKNVVIDWLANFEGNPNLSPCLLTNDDYFLLENNIWVNDGTQSDAWTTHRIYDYHSTSKPEYGKSYYEQYGTKCITLDTVMQTEEGTVTEVQKMQLSIILGKICGAYGVAFGDENWGSDANYNVWEFPKLNMFEFEGQTHTTNVIYGTEPDQYSALINDTNFVANIKPNSCVIDGVTVIDAWNPPIVMTPATKTVLGAVKVGNGMSVAADGKIAVGTNNDGLVVSSTNIKLDTQDNLISTSATKPLSGNQGRVLNEGKVDKTSIKTEQLTSTDVGILSSSASNSLFENGVGADVLGYIEDGTQHNVGEVWLSRNNKGEFKCLVANSDNYLNVTPGAEKWLPIDDLTNADTLRKFVALLGYPDGYQKLSSGLIIQWIRRQSLYNTNTIHTLPITFPNKFLCAIATSDGNSGNNISINSYTNSTITVFNTSASAATPYIIVLGH